MSDFRGHDKDGNRNREENRPSSDRRNGFGDRGRRFQEGGFDRGTRRDFGGRGKDWGSDNAERSNFGRRDSQGSARRFQRDSFDGEKKRWSEDRRGEGARSWGDRSYQRNSRPAQSGFSSRGRGGANGGSGSGDRSRHGDGSRRFEERSDRRNEFRKGRSGFDRGERFGSGRGERFGSDRGYGARERGDQFGGSGKFRRDGDAKREFGQREFRRDEGRDGAGFERGRRGDRFSATSRAEGQPFGKSQGRFQNRQFGPDRGEARERRFNNRRFEERGGRRRADFEAPRAQQRGFEANAPETPSIEQTYERFDEQFASDASRFEGLTIPEGVKAAELGEPGYSALATLGEHNQNRVAKLLVMAGQLIDLDPEQAYLYAQAAVKHAGRVDVVREAAALTAYATGRYAEALREVRAVRRMRGDDSLRAVEADCERGLDRPEKALEIVAETDIAKLNLAEQVELVLVAAGARADMGESDTALVLVDDALSQIEKTNEDELKRRLMLAKVEHLRALGRDAAAAEVELRIPEEEEDNDIIDVQLFADADIDDRRSDLKGHDQAPHAIYDSLILDLDGVCYMGANPVNNAASGITEAVDAGMNQVFVTNNSSRTPQEVADKLSELGIPATSEQVMTSAQDLAAVMADEVAEGASVLVIGGTGLRQAMTEAGYRVVDSADEQPDAVVQGFDRSVDWEKLSEAAFAINAGAAYFATNLDASLPVERGFALGNGALVRAVRYATGKKPVAAGKPLPGIFHRALAKIEGENAICVGDRLETDIACGLNAQLPSMHVLTGVHDAKAVILAERGLRPQLVHRDLRGLNEPHPRPQHHQDGTWTCGVSQVAKVIDGRLSLDGVILEEPTTVTLDSYRALIAAAWDHATYNPKVICPEITVVDNDDPAGMVGDEDEQPTGGYDSEGTESVSWESESLGGEAVVPGADAISDYEEAPSGHQKTGAAVENPAVVNEDDPQVGESAGELVDPEPGDSLDDAIPEFLPGEEDLAALLDETKDLEDR